MRINLKNSYFLNVCYLRWYNKIELFMIFNKKTFQNQTDEDPHPDGVNDKVQEMLVI